jgi:hypothetical protein
MEVTSNGNDVKWQKVRMIKAEAGIKNEVFISYKYDESEFASIPLTKKRKTKTSGCTDDLAQSLQNAYNENDKALYISHAKYKDLPALCLTGIISQQYHSFYRNLKHIYAKTMKSIKKKECAENLCFDNVPE